MKKFIKSMIAAGLSLSMLSGTSLQMFAEDTGDYYKTTEGIINESTPMDPSDPHDINRNVVITIPEDFKGDIIRINPYDNVEDGFNYPGQNTEVNVKVVNNSGRTYHYVNDSVQTYVPPLNFEQETELVYRNYNIALRDLGIENEITQLADEVIGARLKEKNYGADETDPAKVCVEYLDDYYLDYYNDTFLKGDAPKASTLEETNLAYRRAIFNDSSFWAPDGSWVQNENRVNPDTHTLDSEKEIDQRETNVEVNRFSHYHAYHDLVLLGNAGIAEYDDKTSAHYQTLNSMLNQNMFAEDGFTLTRTLVGGAANAYSIHDFYSSLYFTLVADGVTVEEKISEPDLVKKITDGDKIIIDEEKNPGDYATVDASGRVDFTLTSHVGDDLREVITPKEPLDPGIAPDDVVAQFDTTGTYTFTFVDNLDPELTLIEDSIKLMVNNKEYVVPADGITVTPVTEGKYAGHNQIKVTFDLVELFRNEYFTYEEFGVAPIVLTYSAMVKDQNNVVPGKMYNTAWVQYNGKETNPDEVEVDTFGVKVLKYDQTTNEGLAGAEFTLYYVDGEEKTEVQVGVVSGADGYLVFKGLKEGEYELVETKAPAGYVKSEKTLRITVNKEKDDETYYINTQFANAPEVHTGGSGTMMFTIGGGALLLAGAAYYMISRKREAEAE